MPKNNRSSLSSEDEANAPAAESAVNPAESDQATKYQCPPDFVTFCHEPCSSTLAENLRKSKNELWLIKAPASFDPKCFSGIRVSLSGLQSLKVPTAAPGGAKTGKGQQTYNILASNHAIPELHLLTSGKQASDGMVVGPAFSGLLNVCESYSSTNQAPQVIPAAPVPSIPPGLKQRFQPFGSKTPTLTCVAENEVDGAAFGPSSTTLRPLVVKRFIEVGQVKHEREEEEEEGRKKKKKKKKEKQIKTEQIEDVVTVKEEPIDEIQEDATPPFQEGEYLVEKRKKKKKKRDREREEVEEGLEPSVTVKEEEVPVKCEPIDSFFDEVEGSGKRKKKKKKLKTDDD
ncbi:DNA-directed RNA polymerase I subunit RPA34 [Archocentrus centrarchus]|uniref:DNA-directed RNA polymerase I subunit RPA34 n=1 Tax=Archocentrus centrarchus TaxID=63155 RepID=UPI0011E9C58C|nr:DNA-directed RNA polymerase I subunit RPA34 [Archocentrus centrarchus]